MRNGTVPYYWQRFPALAEVVLEESWVLGYRLLGDAVTFDLDAVLTTEHPLYNPPRHDELYATARALLTVTGSSLTFQPSFAPPATDATGSKDYGHIDTFQPADASDGADAMWELTGDWGRIVVTEPDVSLA